MSAETDKTVAELQNRLKLAEQEIGRLRSMLNLQLNENESEAFQNEHDSTFARLLDFLPMEISVLDKNRRYLYINQHHELSAIDQKQVIGITDDELCLMLGLPDAVAINRTFLFNSAAFEKQPKTWEESYSDKEGKEKFLLRTMIPVLNREDEFQYMLSIANDITEQVTTERIVRTSEERYRLMVNGAREYMLVQLDAKGKIESWNNGAIDITGFEPHDVIGKQWSMFYESDGDLQFEKDFTDSSKLSQQDLERVFIRKNGTSFYAEMNVSRLYNLHKELIGYALMARDLTQQRESEKALRESEEKYRSIIENMNMGLIETDENERISFANSSFSTMSGIESIDLIGHSPEETFLNKSQIRVLRKGNREGSVERFRIEEVQYANQLGEFCWWLISVTPRYNAMNEFAGSLFIILDITERKLLETELNLALQNAESLAAAKQIFLANMSHELRTPLNAVIGLTRLLQKENLTHKQQQYLGSIIYSGNNLMNIIADLLDFSKLEAGKMVLQPQTFNLKELIRNNLKMLQFKADEKGITLESELDPELCEYVITDPTRLNQILVNLIGNSVKFTETGWVKIACKVADNKSKSQLLEITVSDTGVGIPSDKLDKVFEMFYQVGYNNPSLNKGGTGLGLSITKQLIERLGGKIKVSSEMGQGTSIQFSLRVGKGSPKNETPIEDALIPKSRFSGKNILLAEDNEINRMLVVAIMEPLGMTVTEAVNGEEAIAWLKKKSFDLVLMDIRMPVMNGVEACKILRRDLQLTIPVIALTADITEDGHKEWIRTGMNDYVIKPFEENDLLRKMARYMGLENMQEFNLDVKDQDLETTAIADEALNMHRLLQITHGDNVFLKRMLSVFCVQMEASLIQMKSFIQSNDYHQLREIIHKIKPGVMNTCSKSTCDLLNSLHEQVKIGDKTNLSEHFSKLEQGIQSTIKAIQFHSFD